MSKESKSIGRAEEVANGLNEAQRRELCRYAPISEGVAFIRLYTIRRRCRHRLPESFSMVPLLAKPRTDRCRIAMLTPLGLTVRAILQEPPHAQ